MPNKILVIQHAPSEGLGSFEGEIKGQKLETVFIKTWENPTFPSPSQLEGYGAIISLGGPMSVTEENKYPWMTKELMVLDEALRQKRPILGVCLGSQLLAKVAGGRVYQGSEPEIGWFPINFDGWFSKRNPLFFQLQLDRPHMVFHWHFDTLDFPTEGYRFAWSDITPNQAFCFQGNAFGIQFHVEMDDELIKDWLTHEESRQVVIRAGFDPDKILKESAEHLVPLQDLAHKVFYGFSSMIRDGVRRTSE